MVVDILKIMSFCLTTHMWQFIALLSLDLSMLPLAPVVLGLVFSPGVSLPLAVSLGLSHRDPWCPRKSKL